MYLTNINIIGGIPDINFIFDILGKISSGENISEIKQASLKKDAYSIRTNKARLRFIKAIKSAFLKFQTEDHKTIFLSLFNHPNLISLKKTAIFLQLAINDQLFFELTNNIFIPLYFSGRLVLNPNEISSYLYDLRDKKTDIQSWSDSTINILASKYLTLLKKFDLIKGTSKKEFKNLMADDLSIIYSIYLIYSLKKTKENFINNPLSSFLLLSQKNLIERIKKISLDNFISVSTLGKDLKIDLKFSYEEIVDVIAKRYQSKI